MNIITNTPDLSALCEQLHHGTYITIDTEFMRADTYYPKLSLIQVACDTTQAIIDPLSDGIDLSPLFDILQAPHITKVLHASRQDLEIFYMLMGSVPTPLFDTQVAAMYLGYGDQVGYDTLVQKTLKKRINKSARFTDWTKRPLTDTQLQYAIGDVTYLRDIYKVLYAMLLEKNRLEWISDEMDILQSPKTYEMDPYESYHRIKHRHSSPQFLNILREVSAVREIQAKALNLPRRRYLKDDTLLDIAGVAPTDYSMLERIRGIPKNWVQTQKGEKIIQAVKTALTMPPETYPTIPEYTPPTKTQSSTVEVLRLLLKICAQNNDIAPRLIATQSDIEAIAKGEITPQDLPTWRYDIFGILVQDIMDGKRAIALCNGHVALVDI